MVCSALFSTLMHTHTHKDEHARARAHKTFAI